MPRSASVGGLAKRGVIPRKQFYNKMLFYNTVILATNPLGNLPNGRYGIRCEPPYHIPSALSSARRAALLKSTYKSRIHGLLLGSVQPVASGQEETMKRSQGIEMM